MGPCQTRRSQNRETLCVCVNARTCRDAASTGAVKTQTHGGKHLENTKESVRTVRGANLKTIQERSIPKLSKPMY